jgi:N-methylhydantoinase B
MTNTANTPVEMLERVHPVRVWTFALRDRSGGTGLHPGGDGVAKEVEFLSAASVSIVGDRRKTGPPGAQGGSPGQPARDELIVRDGKGRPLGAPAQIRVGPGERVRIETPGGGGWGKPG